MVLDSTVDLWYTLLTSRLENLRFSSCWLGFSWHTLFKILCLWNCLLSSYVSKVVIYVHDFLQVRPLGLFATWEIIILHLSCFLLSLFVMRDLVKWCSSAGLAFFLPWSSDIKKTVGCICFELMEHILFKHYTSEFACSFLSPPAFSILLLVSLWLSRFNSGLYSIFSYHSSLYSPWWCLTFLWLWNQTLVKLSSLPSVISIFCSDLDINSPQASFNRFLTDRLLSRLTLLVKTQEKSNQLKFIYLKCCW